MSRSQFIRMLLFSVPQVPNFPFPLHSIAILETNTVKMIKKKFWYTKEKKEPGKTKREKKKKKPAAIP